MGCSLLGSSVLHYLPEFVQIHVHWVGDAIQPSYPLPPSSPFAFSLSQHQGLFQWVSSSHHGATVLELQLQHQSFQWIVRVVANKTTTFSACVPINIGLARKFGFFCNVLQKDVRKKPKWTFWPNQYYGCEEFWSTNPLSLTLKGKKVLKSSIWFEDSGIVYLLSSACWANQMREFVSVSGKYLCK